MAERWTKHKFDLKLINPANRRKFKVLVVGTGLAGSAASATLAEMGYKVTTLCIHDAPRRAHSLCNRTRASDPPGLRVSLPPSRHTVPRGRFAGSTR